MRFAQQIALAAILALAFIQPAAAQKAETVAASSVPEPNDLLLLALGVVGLVVGRQVARKKVDD